MLKACLFFIAVLFGMLCGTQAQQPAGKLNMAFTWGDIAMKATANDTERFSPRPTVTSRFLGLIWTAVYDAWCRYDAVAAPVYLKNVARRPAAERTLQNKETAISFAAYRTMMIFYPSDSVMLTRKFIELGFDPADHSTNSSLPEGIGNLAAAAVISARINDGANQDGKLSAQIPKPYADYTGYRPLNTPDSLTELFHWQPKYFSDGKGGKFAPPCLTPQWGKVQPLFLDSASQFRPGPPPSPHSDEMKSQVAFVVKSQATLTNEQKALVEFMRDGPNSVQQAGHWFMFAQEVSKRDHHTLDDDVKMFFVVEAAAMDAFIACWDTKMYYDFARPYALVHEYYKNATIRGWGGPEKGWIDLPGSEWRPYSPETFLCPAFPSYVSGHSTISAACAEVLRLFTGSDAFGFEVSRIPGELTETDVKNDPVTLKFPTFTETAELAGVSRIFGGYHLPVENTEGLRLGRNVGRLVFTKYLKVVNGSLK